MLRTVCDLTYVRLTGLTLVLVAMILSPADANAIPESPAPKVPLVDNPTLYQQDPPNIWEERQLSQARWGHCYRGYFQCLLSRSEDSERSGRLNVEREAIMETLKRLEREISEKKKKKEDCRNAYTNYLEMNCEDSLTEEQQIASCHHLESLAAKECYVDDSLSELEKMWSEAMERLMNLHQEIMSTHGDPRYDATGNRILTCLSTFQICEALEDSESFYGDSYFVQSTPALFSTPHPQPPAVAHSNTDDQSTQNLITYPIRSTYYSDDAHL